MKKLKKIPKFKNEDEELKFWSKINLADYFKPKDFVKTSFPNLKPSKMKKIPKFKTEKEERNFWDKHSIADYEDELKPTNGITFPKPGKKRLKHKVAA